MMTRKEYEKWFVEQNGKRPKGDNDALAKQVCEGDQAKDTLTLQWCWDEKKKAADYLFNALFREHLAAERIGVPLQKTI